MSGSETNGDVQITLDESGLQVGCGVGKAAFSWLNPDYVVSLPDPILAYGQMTAFVQLSINYLNLTRSSLAERYADMIKDETLGANESLGITNGRA